MDSVSDALPIPSIRITALTPLLEGMSSIFHTCTELWCAAITEKADDFKCFPVLSLLRFYKIQLIQDLHGWKICFRFKYTTIGDCSQIFTLSHCMDRTGQDLINRSSSFITSLDNLTFRHLKPLVSVVNAAMVCCPVSLTHHGFNLSFGFSFHLSHNALFAGVADASLTICYRLNAHHLIGCCFALMFNFKVNSIFGNRIEGVPFRTEWDCFDFECLHEEYLVSEDRCYLQSKYLSIKLIHANSYVL